MNVAEIAAAVGGRVEGDGTIVIRGLASLQEAGPGDLSFLGNVRFATQAERSLAAAIVVANDWAGTSPAALIRVANPDRAFIQAAILLTPVPPPPAVGIHPTAVVAPGVVLGEGVCIGPHAVLETGVRLGARTVIGASCYVGHDTTLGDDCRLHPLVSIRERTRIGNRVIVHNGTVIGSDGFGYAPENGRWVKIPQLGTVEIGDDVELGANVTIDRARFGKTVIGNGVKIDNLVQIAHNVQVGDHTVMAAQAGIAGSAIIGRNVQVGGQVGMAGHLTVGDRTLIAAQSGVSKSIPEGSVVFGTPAMPFDKFKRIHAYLSRLPELKKRVDALEERLEKLEPRVAGAEQVNP